jgi:hypothetical protein
VPPGLKRFQNFRHLHFITLSCFHRAPLLTSARRRDLFLKTLEATRIKFQFVVLGYIVLPEHVHLLVSEPERGSLALAVAGGPHDTAGGGWAHTKLWVPHSELAGGPHDDAGAPS